MTVWLTASEQCTSSKTYNDTMLEHDFCAYYFNEIVPIVLIRILV
jgi:hypothetical protein